MDNQFIPRVALTLTLLGALPFVGLALGISFEAFPLATQLTMLFSYAAVVLAFLGGIHWGFAVSNARTRPDVARIMYLESILTALLGWIILFIPDAYLRLLTFAFLYAVAWGLDSILYNHKLIPLWYFNLRGIVTPIVVVSLYVAYFSII